jgi:hypothetical protein
LVIVVVVVVVVVVSVVVVPDPSVCDVDTVSDSDVEVVPGGQRPTVSSGHAGYALEEYRNTKEKTNNADKDATNVDPRKFIWGNFAI